MPLVVQTPTDKAKESEVPAAGNKFAKATQFRVWKDAEL